MYAILYYFIGYVINFHCSFGTPPLVLSLACDIILQEALFSCPHRLHLSILPRTAESLSFSFRCREKLFQLTIHKKADFEGGRKVDYLIFVSTHSPARGLTAILHNFRIFPMHVSVLIALNHSFIHIAPDIFLQYRPVFTVRMFRDISVYLYFAL